MRLYKLLKDTPTIKAGTIFREVVSDYDGAMELARVTPIGAKTNPQWTIQDINNFDEWFEKIEPTDSIHWKPKIGDRFWTSGNTSVYSQIWKDDEFDRSCYESGKVYKTKEECEKAYKRELAEVRLRRTSTFKPDFENDRGGWVVCHYRGRLDCIKTYSCDSGELVRYETMKDAEKSIKENEQDWKIYFGIKEEE
jgi:hypothetical protein